MTLLRICADIPSHKRHEFEQAVASLLKKKKQNAPSCRIYEEIGHPNRVCYLGEWPSREKLEAYFQSGDFKFLVGAMGVLGEILTKQIITADHIEDLPL